ncbi:hypothetical protein VC83_04350 [Pseudogymnoascus destructans]|uniref:Zn(2)-C6 fungal-type domain-containing protein n=1 Tax=Pseudogymnoascus destructans TaxID=655981 RepID=A0A177ADN1_9PEZI|nr:uncharacterized protein VC83_04350 [Pseudogymnoascus destructans]OAF59293.1 hypothetical protein VC83_04350 [Pseudogymnoascus destructans]
MSPAPPSTGSSTGNSPDTQYRVVRKRNRVPLSCAPCRHKKLKCSRSIPCENCIRRGDAAGCAYAAPGPRRKAAPLGSSPDDMQNRIDRLEGLVLSLMTNGSTAPGPTAAVAAERSGSTSTSTAVDDGEMEKIKEEEEYGEGDEGGESDVDAVANSFGVLKVDAETEKTMYIGDSHWHLVLSDIAEVRNYFTNHKRELDNQYKKVNETSAASQMPDFLFQGLAPATEIELRAGLPPRAKVEKLVARFFNSLDPFVQMLHHKTFYERLEAFFADPKSQSLAWVGLLYATLTLAMLSYSKVGDEPPEWKGRTNELAAQYRGRTVQSLATCDYTRPNVYTVETLVLYVHAEYSSRLDVDFGLYLVVGTVVQVAMRMGYHRDASQFTSVSPYEAEMRRRVWLIVRQIDIIFSAQLTLPNIIKSCDCDTQLPRNIFDDEFSTTSTSLPPSRPPTEATPMSSILAKGRLVLLLGAIIEETQSISGPQASYDTTMKWDVRIRSARMTMEPHLRFRPLEVSALDPSSLILQRFYIEVLHQKTICVLHRRFIARARTNPRYAYSRRASVDAAMALLRIQATLHHEAQPGGRISEVMWRLTALQKHDFLLGAMIVSLDLNHDRGGGSYTFWTAEQRADMLSSLETALAIWEGDQATSMEAYKGAKVLRIMVDKLKAQQSEVNQEVDEEMHPEHSAAMTLGMLSSGGVAAPPAFVASSPGMWGEGYGGPMEGVAGGSWVSIGGLGGVRV